MKKAIANISVAIQIKMNPTPSMINAAPINSSKPVVENKPVADLTEISFSERLKKKAAIIAKIQTTTITNRIAARKGIIAEGSMLLVSGVMPESDAQSPFQLGYIA